VKTAQHYTLEAEAALLAAGAFFGHGTDNALDEAAWLVLHVLGQPLDGGFENWDMPVTAAQGAEIEALLRARLDSRQPLAYLLGEAWFCGLRFTVSADVLVPRSPLAELIFNGFEPWVSATSVQRALDLCTGSGCIAIAMAHYQPGWQVDASDLSAAALAVAAENVAAHGLQQRVQLHQSDLFAQLHGRRYELVVSNPPYVPREVVEGLPPEYQVEPALGLVSGHDGLDIPLRILADAPEYLAEGGVLVCEVGDSSEALQAALPSVPFTWLEFEHGGGGVFTIQQHELISAQAAVLAQLESRHHVG
jgi:ribosomal protein L3 glutamine methyltransferase